MKARVFIIGLPVILAVAGGVLLTRWFLTPQAKLKIRGDGPPPSGGMAFFRPEKIKLPLPGKLRVTRKVPPQTRQDGWPRFRGVNYDGVSSEQTRLADSWPATGPKVLWSVALGEGYSGAIIVGDLIYILDYDQKEKADALRCLTLDKGEELWRRWYSVPIRRQHGYSRTVPALHGKYLATLGPACHVLCSDATTGKAIWWVDLVKKYGTVIPEWYAGQCPLIDVINGRPCVIIAPGGSTLMFARDCETGKLVWETPNFKKRWQMTHSSITPVSFGGKDMYIYPASGGVVGVEKTTGKILWKYGRWRVPSANVPAPIDAGQGKILLSGGYGAGAMMVQLVARGDGFDTQVLFKVKSKVFGCEQQTPILYKGYLYTVMPAQSGGQKGQLACMDLAGKQLWTSGTKARFGLGPFMIADGKILAVNDSGRLTMARATHTGYRQLAEHQVLKGHDSWAPLALSRGLLMVRDSKKMVCLDIRAKKGGM